MDNRVINSSKKEFINDLLQRGTILIMLDANYPGVVVPERYRANPRLVLRISWKFGLFMRLDEYDITCDLTFSHELFRCSVPWGAIRRVRFGEEEYTFKGGDLPYRTRTEMEVLERIVSSKGKLEVIENDKAETSPPKNGHLRLVS